MVKHWILDNIKESLLIMLSNNDMSFLFVFCLFAFSRAARMAYGGSRARGLFGAVAASLHQSHNSNGSEPHLRPTPQLTAMLDP